MYLKYYSLEEKPFQITADPKYFWIGQKQREALSTLQYGITEKRGFLLLTGEVGTGKTVMINYIVSLLDMNTVVATLPDPDLESMDFYNMLADGFDMGLYTPLVELFESGRLGQMDLMERLCIMLSLSVMVSEELSPGASKPLARGMVAPDPSDVPDLIRESAEKQRELLRTLDFLLDKMEEWEDYQELLQLFHDLIDSQHNINILTREELRKRR